MDGKELHLTPIEYKLLCLLSKHVGKVLTHTYITQEIWGRSWVERRGIAACIYGDTPQEDRERAGYAPVYPDTYRVGYRMLRVE